MVKLCDTDFLFKKPHNFETPHNYKGVKSVIILAIATYICTHRHRPRVNNGVLLVRIL